MEEITRVINEYVEPITSAPEFSIIIGFIPTLVNTVRTLTISGSEKKQTVMKALHTFVDLLVTKQVIDSDLGGQFKEFIDLVAPTAIETILGVQKSGTGEVQTSGVEEVKQTNCAVIIPAIIQILISIFAKSKKTQPQPQVVLTPTEVVPTQV